MTIASMIRSYIASADVLPRRIVKFSDVSVSSKVAQGAAATDPLWGVSDAMGGSAGNTVDVVIEGLTDVVLGGTVTAGAPLTSDADGKAVALAAAAGATRRRIGFAEAPGVSGDIIQIIVDRGVQQLPA